jgi:hypothetical protein
MCSVPRDGTHTGTIVYGFLSQPDRCLTCVIGQSKIAFLKMWCAAFCQVVRGGFGRKTVAKIVSDTERMESAHIHVY